MYIEAFQYNGSVLERTVLFKVTFQVLAQNSTAFAAHLNTHGTANNLELHHVGTHVLEVWLRIFHCFNNMPEPTWSSLSINDVQQIITLATKYKFKLSRFNKWFAFWLSVQNLSNVSPATIVQLGQLCQIFEHEIGAECVAVLAGTANNRQLPHALTLYPPVPDTTLLQYSGELYLFSSVPPEDYATWAFSPRFKAVWGSPTAAYSDFKRLVTTAFNPVTLPKYKTFDALLSQQSTFLNFCKTVDSIAAQKNLGALSRRAMEGAWACVALDLYDNSSTLDAEGLHKVFEMRFHPRGEIEQYWEHKCAKFGWDIKGKDNECLDDNCEEPDHRMAEPDEDEEMVDTPGTLPREIEADLRIGFGDLGL
ncbi:hypothetical protein WAI453_008333 [Rhynchosporium graminicola]|uniref:Uncharacterized protein n=1 Tax=Rhynchosporium graminicola TaxID=2792576 RepID=A0A1E1KMH4_9HELO|nr:uncharacterized protein RCO7_00486 [Rhynchosporium commune]